MVNLNASPSNSFKIEKGVKQGYHLALYLFLIVGEALTHLITKAVSDGRHKRLPSRGVKNNKASRNMRMTLHSWLGVKSGMLMN